MNVHFDRDRLTAIVYLDPEKVFCQIPKKIFELAEELGMNIKEEFHITLIGNSLGQKLKEIITTEKEIEQLKSLVDVVGKQLEVSNMDFKKAFYVCEKQYNQIYGEEVIDLVHTRSSLVQLVKMPVHTEFINDLKRMFDIEGGEPLTHITLFTTATDSRAGKLGIGMQDIDEFSKCMKRSIIL